MAAQLDIKFHDAVSVPDARTQNGMLIRAFQRGERLTIWEAMFRYGVGALHQRVKELKDKGWPIRRAEVMKNGKRVAEFWMDIDRERITA